MMPDWNDYQGPLPGRIGEIAKLSPGTLHGYATLGEACITVHTDAAVKHGITREKIAKAPGVSIAVNAGAALATTLLPAATQYLVQRGTMDLLGKACRDQPPLRNVKRTLRIHQDEKAVASRLVARLRESVDLRSRRDQRPLRLELVSQRAIQHQRVRNLAKTRLHRLPVLRQRDITFRLGNTKVRAQLSALKNRQVDARKKLHA